MKAVLAGIALFVGVTVVAVALGFGTGYLNVFYKKTVGKANINADTQNFHEAQGYVDGAISDLSNYRVQWLKEKDPIAKKAIEDLILTDYANFDTSKILNDDLRMFVEGIRSGE